MRTPGAPPPCSRRPITAADAMKSARGTRCTAGSESFTRKRSSVRVRYRPPSSPRSPRGLSCSLTMRPASFLRTCYGRKALIPRSDGHAFTVISGVRCPEAHRRDPRIPFEDALLFGAPGNGRPERSRTPGHSSVCCDAPQWSRFVLAMSTAHRSPRNPQHQTTQYSPT